MNLAAASTTTATTIVGVLGVVLSLPAWFFFLRAALGLYRFVDAGQPTTKRTGRLAARMGRMLKEVFGHTEMMRKPAVAVAHWFVMLGFLLGAVVWFEAYIQTFAPDSGWPLLGSWSVYHFAEEILAIGTVLGIAYLFALRLNIGSRERLARFYGSNMRAGFFIEAIVFIEGLGMLLVKAAQIATYGENSSSVWADFFTRHLASLLPASPLLVSIFALVKLLTGMVWLFVVAHNITWGVAWHRFLAFFSILFTRHEDGSKSLGDLVPMLHEGEQVTLENVDKLGDDPVLGVGTLADASWKMLLDAATCTECGRCQEQCPAWHTEKPLSPKLFLTDIRDAAVANASYLQDPATFEADTSYENVDLLKIVGEDNIIHPDVLWSCTNCGACVEQCPVDIEHIDHVANLRRFQVLAESDFPSELTGMFRNLEVKGNPWGQNNSERATWVEEARRDGIPVPVFGEDIHDFEDTEYLFWVGCAGAFDEEGKKTTRAVVELLHTAGVKYAVLSTGETCTGDPARRAGNEFLFQQLTLENVATLNDVFDGVPPKQRKIITTCPHCFNTLRNEYPDFDGHYEVFHHTQLLNRLVREGLLTPVPRGPENRRPVTFHDPCFLGRHNKIFDPPRELIGATGANLVEMDRTRNEGFCCGAGGARMFMEENLGTRINENRAAEALSTGAEEIAVGCPFCNTMMLSGVKATAPDSAQAPVIRDVAQMLNDAIRTDNQLPSPRTPAFLEPPTRLPRKEQEAAPRPEHESKPAAKQTPAPAPAPKPAVPGAPKAPGGIAVPGRAVPTPQAPKAPVPAAPSAVAPKAPAVPTAPAGVPPRPTAPTFTAPVPAAPTPQAAAPTPKAPVPSVPKPAAPKAPIPQATVPKAPVPSVPKPSVPKPSVPPPAAPKAPIPQAAVPKAPVPSAPMPKAPVPSVPKPAVPKPSVPQPAAPQAPTPKAPTPQVSVPKAPVPSAPVPSAPIPPAPQPPVPPAPQPPVPPAPQPPVPPAPQAPGVGAVGDEVGVVKPKPSVPRPPIPGS